MSARGAAFITGASKRIGAAIAKDLARDGRPVAIHCNNSTEEARQTVQEIEAQGGTAVIVQGNLGDHDRVLEMIPEATGLLDCPIDVLINNASLFQNDRLRDATQHSFDAHMAVNLRAPLFLAQQFAKALPQDHPGNVINLIDMRVWKPAPGFISYTLSKAGLEMLTKTMAMALAPTIRVNGIGPGPVLPNERQTEEQFQRQWQSTLLQRGAEPGEIAAAVRFILSAPSITGQMIALDGGQHLPWPPLDKDVSNLDG